MLMMILPYIHMVPYRSLFPLPLLTSSLHLSLLQPAVDWLAKHHHRLLKVAGRDLHPKTLKTAILAILTDSPVKGGCPWKG